MIIRGAAVASALLVAQLPVSPANPVGVLVGIHRTGVEAGAMGEDHEPPSAGQLRTIWLSIDGTSGSQAIRPVELPDLLLPRRTGFWRVGLLGTCSEAPFLDVNDKRLGTAIEIADYVWTAPLGRRPRVTLQDPTEPVRPCSRRDVYCGADRTTAVYWVWPDYLSLESGERVDCIHPDWVPGYTIRRVDDLARVTIEDALGSAVESRFRAALDAAVKARADHPCAEPARFDSASWHIERQPGGWKAEGWSTTHRLCGYGEDFTVDVDLSAITGRHDDRERWQMLKARMPQLTDAHFAPGARWILATTDKELLLFDEDVADRPAIRMPLSDRDKVVMVEWATGSNVARWTREVRRARQGGQIHPLVVR